MANLLMQNLEVKIKKALQDQENIECWIEIHAVLTGIEQLTRVIELEDIASIH